MKIKNIYNWKVEEEYFNFIGISWDVQKAKQILTKKKTLDVHDMDVKEWVKLIARSTENTLSIGITVNWDELDHPIDLNFPVIIAQHPKIGNMIIDGWHRISMADSMNVTTIKGVLLSKKDSKEILIQ